jgi:hypothetical protein
MRLAGLIIGKGKMRGIRRLEILWLDTEPAVGLGAFSVGLRTRMSQRRRVVFGVGLGRICSPLTL